MLQPPSRGFAAAAPPPRRASRAASLILAGLALIASDVAARAIVGGMVDRDPDGLRRFVVRVEVPQQEQCSGAVIGPDLVLTAAHCVDAKSGYRVIAIDRAFRARPMPVIAAAVHPRFVPGTTPTAQTGVDLAILRLEQPLGRDFSPLDPMAAGAVTSGQRLWIAGFGIAAEGDSRAERTLRKAQIAPFSLFELGRTVRVFADDKNLAESFGVGACRGDSGGPLVLGGPDQYRLIAIVSWSSGAFHNGTSFPCGGLTGATPVADHIGWIVDVAASLRRGSRAAPLPSNRKQRLTH
jgi:trypsin